MNSERQSVRATLLLDGCASTRVTANRDETNILCASVFGVVYRIRILRQQYTVSRLPRGVFEPVCLRPPRSVCLHGAGDCVSCRDGNLT